MQLVVDPNGRVRCVYDEAIDLRQIGRLAVCRGSLVEPNDQALWSADLAPVGGPCLGPFRHRSDALKAERQWLDANWLTRSPSA